MVSLYLVRWVSPWGRTCSCGDQRWLILSMWGTSRSTCWCRQGTLVGPVQDQPGQNQLQFSPAEPVRIWPCSCPAWFTTVPLPAPTPWLDWAVHCQDGGEDRDAVRPSTIQDGGCSDSNHHEPAQGGCQRWVLTTALQHRGVWEAPPGHGHYIRWSAVAVGALSCWLDSHGQAATGHMEVKRRTMRLGSLTNAGTESSVFIGFVQKGLYKEQADSAAHTDAHTCCCLSSSPGILGTLLSLAEQGCTNQPMLPRCLPGSACARAARESPGSTHSNHGHMSAWAPTSAGCVGKGPSMVQACTGSSTPQTSALLS